MIMNSQEIQDKLYDYLHNKNFNAPYGILTSDRVNEKGKKYKSITFGRARTLDAEIRIYNSKFILLRTSRHTENVIYKSYDDLISFLETI